LPLFFPLFDNDLIQEPNRPAADAHTMPLLMLPGAAALALDFALAAGHF
jgi:hypothetical protein